MDHKRVDHESWIIKKADAKELMLSKCGAGEDSWESLGLKGDQTSQILKEVNTEYSLEGLMLKLQHFGHLMWRADSLENNLMLGKRVQEETGVTEDEMVR